jgi:hypothetical protein
MKLETPIFCHGEKTTAWFDPTVGKWRCARCGSLKVRVAT